MAGSCESELEMASSRVESRTKPAVPCKAVCPERVITFTTASGGAPELGVVVALWTDTSWMLPGYHFRAWPQRKYQLLSAPSIMKLSDRPRARSRCRYSWVANFVDVTTGEASGRGFTGLRSNMAIEMVSDPRCAAHRGSVWSCNPASANLDTCCTSPTSASHPA